MKMKSPKRKNRGVLANDKTIDESMNSPNHVDDNLSSSSIAEVDSQTDTKNFQSSLPINPEDTSLNNDTTINVEPLKIPISNNGYDHEDTSTNVENDESSSLIHTAEELYKMRAHGKRGRRSPTRIEFQSIKSQHNHHPKKPPLRQPKTTKLYYQKKTSPKFQIFGFLNKNRYPRHCPINNNNNTKIGRINQPPSCCYCCTKNCKCFKENLEQQQHQQSPYADVSSSIESRSKGNHDDKQSGISRKSYRDDEFKKKNKQSFKNGSRILNDDDGISERMEIYYFDHGNSAYFRTTDCPPHIYSELLAQQTQNYATKFWAEIFGSIHIVLALIVAFLLQFYRFLLYAIVRPLIIGAIQMTADYFIKPILTILFNGIIQPPLIFLYNILSSVCDLIEPIGKTIGHLLKPFTTVFQAIRLVDIRNVTRDGGDGNRNAEDTTNHLKNIV